MCSSDWRKYEFFQTSRFKLCLCSFFFLELLWFIYVLYFFVRDENNCKRKKWILFFGHFKGEGRKISHAQITSSINIDHLNCHHSTKNMTSAAYKTLTYKKQIAIWPWKQFRIKDENRYIWVHVGHGRKVYPFSLGDHYVTKLMVVKRNHLDFCNTTCYWDWLFLSYSSLWTQF